MGTAGQKIFDAEQVIILDRAWVLASSLVADDFRLDFDDIHSWPVDIRRYPELRPEEMTEGVFAQLFRYLRPGPVVVGGLPDYYRICLYDPAILKALENEPGLALEPLLTYILTHEFIHVARFARFMEIFDSGREARRMEEEVVHKETFRLLKGGRMPGLDLVLDLYKNHRLPVD
ncbi:hypothetical protein C4J81_01170 [Deltaproteobacteria bacterium Smac51]|nr:hypothetical protein C4J81_01170 [Deltaproteobacteria bacterium Smac51]